MLNTFQAPAQLLPLLVALDARRAEILDGWHVRAPVQFDVIFNEVAALIVEALTAVVELSCASLEVVALGGELLDCDCARWPHRAQRLNVSRGVKLTQRGVEQRLCLVEFILRVG